MLLDYFISLTLFPFIFVFVSILFFYRCLVTLFLILTVEDFDSVLRGKNARMALSSISKSIPNIIFLIDFETSDHQKVYDDLLKNLTDLFSSAKYPKIRCTLHKKLGYFYLKKDQFSAKEALSTFTDHTDSPIMEMESVRQYLDEVNNKNMPKNDQALIEFIISEKPVRYENRNSVFVLFIRFQYCLTDGPGFLHFVLHSVSIPQTRSNFFHSNEENFKENDLKIMETIGKLLLSTYYFIFGTFTTMKIASLRPKEKNLFHKGELSGSKIGQWFIENEPLCLVQKMRDIRKESGVSFTDAILTCIAASLKQFANKRNESLDSITNVDTMITQHMDLTQLPTMENTFGTNVLYYSLTSLNKNPKSLLGLLSEINNVNNTSKSSIALPATDVFIKVFGTVLPEYLMQRFLTGENITFAFSNMSRVDKMKFFGKELEQMMALPPNDGSVGLSFVVASYRNKLFCSLLADKSSIDAIEDVEEILQGVIKNIHQLHRECCYENTKL